MKDYGELIALPLDDEQALVLMFLDRGATVGTVELRVPVLVASAS